MIINTKLAPGPLRALLEEMLRQQIVHQVDLIDRAPVLEAGALTEQIAIYEKSISLLRQFIIDFHLSENRSES